MLACLFLFRNAKLLITSRLKGTRVGERRLTCVSRRGFLCCTESFASHILSCGMFLKSLHTAFSGFLHLSSLLLCIYIYYIRKYVHIYIYILLISLLCFLSSLVLWPAKTVSAALLGRKLAIYA